MCASHRLILISTLACALASCSSLRHDFVGVYAANGLKVTVDTLHLKSDSTYVHTVRSSSSASSVGVNTGTWQVQGSRVILHGFVENDDQPSIVTRVGITQLGMTCSYTTEISGSKRYIQYVEELGAYRYESVPR